MFDILFGWRKASKCKKLIRRVQCRLKLLKNKRCSIVRQLRDDVAQLLRHGHEQSAFDRVEQLFKDESIVAVYDLLDHFCEFLIIHHSYIRKHKDCPNDINEAISTLIFASARCGDLPELPVIRKLFGERYGQRFATVALELLPGNLVNRQIKENLSIKSVPDDVKYRLVDEIARSCLQQGPLALEYYPELQNVQTNNTSCNGNEEPQLQAVDMMETEGKIVHVDCSSDSKKLQIEPCHPHQGCDSTGTSTPSSTVLHASPNSVELSMHRKEEGRVENNTHRNSPYEIRIPGQCATRTWSASGTYTAPSEHKEVGMAAESSSESSSQLPKEMIYLDDIEEFKSPMSKQENCQDQRVFMFKSSVTLTTDKPEDGLRISYMEKNESRNENAGSRISRKGRKASGKRQRRRSVSQESRRSLKDVESTIYYEELGDDLQNGNCKSHHRRKHQKKIPFDENQKSHCAQARLDQPCRGNTRNYFRSGEYCRNDERMICGISSNKGTVHECSLEHPCYFCISHDKDDWACQKRRMTTLEGFPAHSLKEENAEQCICHCQCPHNQGVEWEVLLQKPRRDHRIGMKMGDNLTYHEHQPDEPIKKLGKTEGSVHPQSCASSLCSCSRVTSPWTRKETQPPYLRTMTMPPERPSDCHADNLLRSNSFPFPQPKHLSNGSSACHHVHPKLPDYDQLAAKFMALKKANLQYKSNDQ